MTLAELAATSVDDVVLSACKWVCLGLCLSITTDIGDNDRQHYLALRLVKVDAGAYDVYVCDGISTNGELRLVSAAVNAGDLEDEIYVTCGLYVDSQLFTYDFARTCSDSEVESMNLGHQRANVCVFNTVYALLALNHGLCEMLALGGALSAATDATCSSGAKAMLTLQYCLLDALFRPASGMEANNKEFVRVIGRSMRKVDGPASTTNEICKMSMT